MTTRLDISIGPVQGFVAQSRRTRDLWGSSYLLAFLSAHAMRGANEAGGKIIQPVVDNDRLYRWVSGQREGEPPRIGSVPNHFVVEVGGDARSVAHAGERSLNNAWVRVCRAVWEQFVEHGCPAGEGTEDIWNRQTDGFWEVMWTAGPSNAGSGLLARRKHWRTHRPPDEPGDKCTVMPELQELSGHLRAEGRDRFWEWVRSRLGPLDLRDKERLCAIALVKRLFPKVAPAALGWEVDTSHWPSTVYVGAVPWIRRVKSVAPEEGRKYADAVRDNVPQNVLAERHPPFAGLNDSAAGDFSKLDANYFLRDWVQDKRRCPLADSAADGTRDELVRQLETLYDAEDEDGRLGPPPAFYALLLADGDRLGELVSVLDGQRVGEALAAFTGEVRRVVEDHYGVTVYAGGDDVLAMLPVLNALTCAEALSERYRNAFADTDARGDATLSAAVVFPHMRLPLNYALGEAHRLLDTVAKDDNGRNSLAAAVLKPGGPYCQWVTAWTRRSANRNASAVALLGGLVQQLGTNAAEPGLSSALIYRLRDTLTRLCGWEQWQPGNWGDLPRDLDISAFLRAEICHSLDVRMDGGAKARADELTAIVWNLLGQARNPSRDEANVFRDDTSNSEVTQAGIDALLLARFLTDPEQREADR